jgi:hypothetical protein
VVDYALHPDNPRVVAVIRDILVAYDWARRMWKTPRASGRPRHNGERYAMSVRHQDALIHLDTRA